MTTPRPRPLRNPQHWASASLPPLQRFLSACHADFWPDHDGAVADYIPELSKADPSHFGIGLATLDGHVYEVGDSRIPFTIQSMSKPFVFALALDTLGADKVERVIGVEPSGDPFNSIRLNADNHPFNPMVNAGAIACTGLIREAKGEGAFDYIREALGRFAGRPLDVDDAVFTSESATGDRNRAIAYLLRTSNVIREDVAAVLAVYFRQCAVLVSARDSAIMAATLANRGVNPVTGEQVVSAYAVSRTLSVMTSSGMYDFAGEWIYRVGIPAKSGVGGGILASLPARLGLGSYSPRLDHHGNSVRGIKVCEALSSHYGLHMLSRSDDARTSIIADYDIGASPSRRSRRAHERNILVQHPDAVRVLELVGTLSLSSVDYVSRRLAANQRPQFVIFDLRRVTAMTPAGLRLLAELFHELADFHVTVVLSGIRRSSAEWQDIIERTGDINNVRDFYLLDTAIEWAEDQIVYRHGGAIDFLETTELSEQPLLAGLAETELGELAALATIKHYQQGERIIAAGEPATSLFFVRSGAVHVTLPDGIRLATLTAGQAFGEMALLEPQRSADVFADFSATAFEIPLADFNRFRDQHPKACVAIMRNLAQLLADRLIVANARLNLLTPN
ncbi:putative glutaminase [Bradyrhizobium sp. STM 3843]|uniref:glutaminase A n=1 Tax=Bradyrhizobium sp. STM 3843 TaxID=551947 RepID=UPI00024071A3|nr:glutaminase A [Bradyrhizobium sp. STM 3843]CCE06651.1 putative glutaminase [Bradyrhizobium sp. STM 3843]